MADEVGHKAAWPGGGTGCTRRPTGAGGPRASRRSHRQWQGLELVVRHEQGGGPCGFQDAAHLVRQPFAQVYVQVGKGSSSSMSCGRGARARARPRAAAGRPSSWGSGFAAFQAHQLQHLGHAGSLFGAGSWWMPNATLRPTDRCGTARSPETPCQCGAARAARSSVALLTTLLVRRISPLETGSSPRYGTQQSGLAAARRADEHADVARMQAQRNTMNGGLVRGRRSAHRVGRPLGTSRHSRWRMLKIRICIPAAAAPGRATLAGGPWRCVPSASIDCRLLRRSPFASVPWP